MVLRFAEDQPIILGSLVKMVEVVFPTHTLDELAIIQAEEDVIVIGAKLGKQTRLA